MTINWLAALTVVLMMGFVLARVFMLRRRGIEAVKFGKLDRTDFLLPPLGLFYFYLIFAHAFGWPSPARSVLFHAEVLAWTGVLFCAAGLGLLLWSLVSFGRSFRIGIDTERPDRLITQGAFSFSRNPIYTAFASILLGQFLIFPNWLLLVYLLGGAWLFHRQVLREEEYLKEHYGEEYREYCRRVRRYL